MHETIPMPEKRDHPSLLSIPVPTLAKISVSLPIVGFLYSIVWSVLFHFQRTTWTHCGVSNWLPSISAAFNYPPMSFVWRTCIAFHSAPRILYVVLYYQHNKQRRMKQTGVFSRYQGWFALLAAFLHSAENLSLVLLTNISSGENKTLHVISFSSFVGFSLFYLILACFIQSAMTIETSTQARTLRLKKRYCAANVLSLLFAVYFYYRHNKYCEPGVYTAFAFCEYVFVFTNIAFHYIAALDFEEYAFKVDRDVDVKIF